MQRLTGNSSCQHLGHVESILRHVSLAAMPVDCFQLLQSESGKWVLLRMRPSAIHVLSTSSPGHRRGGTGGGGGAALRFASGHAHAGRTVATWTVPNHVQFHLLGPSIALLL